MLRASGAATLNGMTHSDVGDTLREMWETRPGRPREGQVTIAVRRDDSAMAAR